MPERSRADRIPFAAAFTVAAGVIHLAVAGPHFADAALLGAAFVVTGWAQLGVGVLAVRCWRGAGWLVAGINAAAIVAWAVSRTMGLPVGHPGPEAVGVADLFTVGLEIAAIGLLIWRETGHARPRWTRAFAATVLAWTLSIAGSAVAIANIGDHGHSGSHHPTSGEEPVTGRDHLSDREPTGDVSSGLGPRVPPSSPPASQSTAADEPTPRSSPRGSTRDHTHAPGEGH